MTQLRFYVLVLYWLVLMSLLISIWVLLADYTTKNQQLLVDESSEPTQMPLVLDTDDIQNLDIETDNEDSPGQPVFVDPEATVRDYNKNEVECLALNIYHESRGSIFADRVAVADVVLNRVNDTRYPKSVCKVVKQGTYSKWHLENTGKKVPVLNKCQFSWYCDGLPDKPSDQSAWEDAQYIAHKMYYHDEFRGISEGATHYHAEYVSPYWASSLQQVGKIGSHVFYRWVK